MPEAIQAMSPQDDLSGFYKHLEKARVNSDVSFATWLTDQLMVIIPYLDQQDLPTLAGKLEELRIRFKDRTRAKIIIERTEKKT